MKQTGISVFQEPVQTRWKNCLSIFYHDKSRWGFTFQLEVLEWFNFLRTLFISIRKNQATSSTTLPILVDRSPMASYHIFAKDMQNSGHLTIWEADLLRRLVKNWGWIPEHTFFVHTPYKTALKRLKERDRTIEKDIQKDFLWQLELRHRAFIHSGLCGEVHILDGSLSKQELLTSAISEITAIYDRKRVKQRIHRRWPWSLQFHPPQCDWEIKMRIARIMWGPLPRLFAQTLRCHYLVTPSGTSHTSLKVRNLPGDTRSTQNEIPRPGNNTRSRLSLLQNIIWVGRIKRFVIMR